MIQELICLVTVGGVSLHTGVPDHDADASVVAFNEDRQPVFESNPRRSNRGITHTMNGPYILGQSGM
jgi:hypothetical protein